MIPVFFVFITAIIAVCSTDIDTAICSLIASTNVQTIRTDWACTTGMLNIAVCSLSGVNCASSTTLTAIALSSLSGTLPQQISLLTSLTRFDISSSSLRGFSNIVFNE